MTPKFAQKVSGLSLSCVESVARAELVANVCVRFGERLRELLRFGSRARGDGDADSVLDVTIVVDGLTG